MKLSIDKPEFQKGLARIQAIVEKRNTMPILANVLPTAQLVYRARVMAGRDPS